MFRTSTTNNSNRDHRAAKLLLTVYKAMGLAPFGATISPGSEQRSDHGWDSGPCMIFATSRFGLVYNLELIALQVCVLIVVLPTAYGEYEPDAAPVTVTADKLGIWIGLIAIIVIWLTLGFRQNEAVRLLDRLTSFDRTAHCLDGIYTPESSRSFFLWICSANVIMAVAILTTTKIALGPLVTCYVFKAPALIICAWFASQYTFLLKLIENRFAAVNRRLADCEVSPIVDSSHRIVGERESVGNGDAVRNIAALRQAHYDLSRIASDTAAFYSIPILFCVAFAFYTSVYSVYNIMMPFVVAAKNWNIIRVINLLFWISQRFTLVTFLATGVTNVVTESIKTREIVKQLRIGTNIDHDVNIELHRFLLELLHRDIVFTACNLFSLDLTLVTSMIGVVLTYIMVLLQCDL